ncbi:hypothetical protein BTM25_47470 [Actinomadura rubteroloni]|uniref:Integral membrane protein n=1 Tax=Actinomadura rubteroloni TaxID=1926885 RepID=A0A2P4UEZ9_9ACTN|nr:DUF6114 domain-containing protein [Actinomadura rubteroloni]POM23592.1 hypothetical protein BTM25_47470 [Actinomadura rubteroloni]
MSGASADFARRAARRAHRSVVRWRRWRRTRPFWAGLLTLAGGLTIAAAPAGGYTILRLPGLSTLAPLAFGGALTALGVAIWNRPRAHSRAGAAAIVLALGAFVYAGLGGYLLGTLLSLTGGSLACAWTTGRQTRRRADPADE